MPCCPTSCRPSHLGRLSGWGWGLGYAGGLGCLALALVGFVQTDTPWFGLDKGAAEHIRVVAVLVAVWFAVFSLPLFLFTPDTPSRKLPVGVPPCARASPPLSRPCATSGTTARSPRFLLAHMIYIDGLNTLFAFGGIYAAGTFGMDFSEMHPVRHRHQRHRRARRLRLRLGRRLDRAEAHHPDLRCSSSPCSAACCCWSRARRCSGPSRCRSASSSVRRRRPAGR